MCKTKTAICLNCGKAFAYDPHNGRDRKYCSKTCATQNHWREGRMRTDCNSKENKLAMQDRPLTADTAYYVRLWNAKGDSPEEIAVVLNRNVKQIREILGARYAKYQ